MSQLSYYGTDPQAPRHRGGLIAWGVVLIAGGSLLSCSGIVGIVALGVMSSISVGGTRLGGNSSGIFRIASSLIVAIGMYGSLIWIGIGSCLGKRWVRPLVLIGCVVCIVIGSLSVIPMIYSVTAVFMKPAATSPPSAPMFAPGAPPPPMLTAISMSIGIIFAIGMLVIAPMFMYLFYRQQSVKASLETTDPKPRWTDNIPLPILGWAIGSVVIGAGQITSSAAGVFPFFNEIITGIPAITAMCAIGVLLIIGGLLSYRRSELGWAITLAVLVFLAVSAVVFCVRGDSTEYQKIIMSNFAPMLKSTSTAPGGRTTTFSNPGLTAAPPMIVPALSYMLAVGFGLWLRPRFKAGRATGFSENHDVL